VLANFWGFKSGQVKETGISINKRLIFFNFCGDENHCMAAKNRKKSQEVNFPRKSSCTEPDVKD